MNKIIIKLLLAMILIFAACTESETILQSGGNTDQNSLPDISGYPIVSTNQTKFYNNMNEKVNDFQEKNKSQSIWYI